MALWWLTLHGTTPSQNLQTVTAAGAVVNAALLQTSASGEPVLDELRGFVFDGESNLYICNASGSDSSIVRFSPSASSAQYLYSSTFATENVTHPFDIVLGFGGNLFVSNQSHGGKGGNVVTYYDGFGTTTGSYVGEYSDKFQDVRGLAFDGNYLYIADTGAGTVTPYDKNAKKGKVIDKLTKPCHLYYDGAKWLYVASESDGISVYDTHKQSGKASPFLPTPNPAYTLSGFAFGNDGYLYVCNRKGSAIVRYVVTPGDPPTVTGAALPFITTTDEPEFIQLMG